MNRRDVMAGVAGALAASHAARALAPVGPRLDRFERVIYDARVAACRSFAEEARALGGRVDAIEGDITALWYDDLYYRWREGPSLMAGLTLEPAAFQLGLLCQDWAHRVAYRGEHRDEGRTLAHDVAGPASMTAAMLAEPGLAWPTALARSMARFKPGPRSARRGRSTTTGGGDIGPGLVSWIIAPSRPLTG